jgi:predicted phage terminase large subunit-like protein
MPFNALRYAAQVSHDNFPAWQALQERKRAELAAPVKLIEPYELSFGDHIANVCPGFKFTKHTERLIEIGQRVLDGELKNALVMLPPRHYKSTIFSRLLPSCYIRRNPSHTIGLGAHTQTLANEFSEAARGYYIASGGIVSPSTSGKEYWKTSGDIGGMWAAGVGKGTGLPANGLIVDDPTKGREEADSAAHRRQLHNWMDGVLATRLEPNAWQLYIHTRWHELDAIGYKLSKVEELESQGLERLAEKWHVIIFPIEAEALQIAFPKSVTIETDDREPGKALDPTRYDEDWIEKTKANTPDRDWESVYQQRPSAGAGTVFLEETFKYYVNPGETMLEGDRLKPSIFIRVLASLDCTFKDTAGTDMVGIGLWGQAMEGFFLLDIIDQRMDFPNTLGTIKALRPQWNFTELAVEDKANGSAVIQTLKSEAVDFIIHEVNPMGGKVPRANAAAVEFKKGRVFLPRWASWLPKYKKQLLQFPASAFDDQVDQTSQAICAMTGTGPMKISTVHYGRASYLPSSKVNPEELKKQGWTDDAIIALQMGFINQWQE